MEKKVEIVIYGATGFTGKFILRQLLKKIDEEKQTPTIRVAIAGRNESKLAELNAETGRQLPIIIAATESPQSMLEMCQQSRVLINCVGPYRFHGEPVVQACIAGKCNYVDVTGEPEFMENMAFKYGSEAQKAGVTLVHSCGFDSIPADLGWLFATRSIQQKEGPQTVVSSVDSYLTVEGGAHGVAANYGTWHSLIFSLANAHQLTSLRKQAKQLRSAEDEPHREGKAVVRSLPFFERSLGKWSLKFPGADASVVRSSQYSLHQLERKREGEGGDTKTVYPHYSAYFTIPSFFWLVVMAVMGLLLQIMVNFSWTRSLLLKYPRLFSLNRFRHEGPSMEQIASTTFRMEFFARSGKNVYVSRVAGPEPGYVTTAITSVAAALTILHSADSTRIPTGVLTPAAAFARTDLIDRLQTDGLSFSFLGLKEASKA